MPKKPNPRSLSTPPKQKEKTPVGAAATARTETTETATMAAAPARTETTETATMAAAPAPTETTETAAMAAATARTETTETAVMAAATAPTETTETATMAAAPVGAAATAPTETTETATMAAAPVGAAATAPTETPVAENLQEKLKRELEAKKKAFEGSYLGVVADNEQQQAILELEAKEEQQRAKAQQDAEDARKIDEAREAAAAAQLQGGHPANFLTQLKGACKSHKKVAKTKAAQELETKARTERQELPITQLTEKLKSILMLDQNVTDSWVADGHTAIEKQLLEYFKEIATYIVNLELSEEMLARLFRIFEELKSELDRDSALNADEDHDKKYSACLRLLPEKLNSFYAQSDIAEKIRAFNTKEQARLEEKQKLDRLKEEEKKAMITESLSPAPAAPTAPAPVAAVAAPTAPAPTPVPAAIAPEMPVDPNLTEEKLHQIVEEGEREQEELDRRRAAEVAETPVEKAATVEPVNAAATACVAPPLPPRDGKAVLEQEEAAAAPAPTETPVKAAAPASTETPVEAAEVASLKKELAAARRQVAEEKRRAEEVRRQADIDVETARRQAGVEAVRCKAAVSCEQEAKRQLEASMAEVANLRAELDVVRRQAAEEVARRQAAEEAARRQAAEEVARRQAAASVAVSAPAAAAAAPAPAPVAEEAAYSQVNWEQKQASFNRIKDRRRILEEDRRRFHSSSR